MAKTLIIEGQNIDGIASFYDEINRVNEIASNLDRGINGS